MSDYQPVFHAKAAVEVRGLPERAGKALWATLASVTRNPWQEASADPLMGDDAFRFVLFDDGDGVAHVWVDEQARTVMVHGVTWNG
ncbi:hypothetical protein [Actinomadura geliboluensis]|uniref:hypothetical protein n=1 Tax=Actinomadura geliboluensis TaxID=882440 RepID=UPI0036CEF076